MLCDGFGHAVVVFCAPASFRLLVFWILLLAWTSVFNCVMGPSLCSPGSPYPHVQSDHFHACSPGREERSKSVPSRYSSDELLSARPARLAPDLVAPCGLSIWGFCLPRTQKGGRRKVKKVSVVSRPHTDRVSSSEAIDQAIGRTIRCSVHYGNLVDMSGR